MMQQASGETPGQAGSAPPLTWADSAADAPLRRVAYPSDRRVRQRLLPHCAHGAKANLYLLADIIRRYTQPGELVLDPMAGVGSLLLAATLGRQVLLTELESSHVAASMANAAHLRACWLLPLAGMHVVQADARRLPLSHGGGDGAGCAAVLVSPPYGESLSAVRAGRSGDYQQRLYRLVRARIDVHQSVHVGGPNGVYRRTLPDDRRPPATIVVSPPYGDLAQRQRGSEPATALRPGVPEWVRERRDPAFHVDRYGRSAAQLGNTHYPEYLVGMRQVYAECRRVLLPGGRLIVITADYWRRGQRVDLRGDTQRLCVDAGFHLEAWWQRDRSHQLSVWQHLRAHQGRPVVLEEDIQVFRKE